MKKFLIILGVLVLGASAVAVAMSGNSEDKVYSWRYKMTVEVETPEGVKTGSAVREMSAAPKGVNLPDVGNPADVRGEAVVIDLGARGVLFALISHESDNRFRDAFPIPGQTDGQGGSTAVGIKYHASLPVGTKGVLDPKEPPGYPRLVTFTDINDPKSVTLTQVWERNNMGYFDLADDRMEELFGEGVKLKSIILEITEEKVTWKIGKLLLWLEKIGGGYLHGGFTSKGAPLGLHGGNFKIEEPQ